MKIWSFINLVGAAITIFVLSDLVGQSNGQYFTLGLCPRLGGMPNFNITRYDGVWYEVEKYWFIFEATASCAKMIYAANPKDGTFGVEISLLERIIKMTMPGRTWYRSRDGSADFMLSLSITQSPIPFNFKYPYVVLDTDYDNYTMKYSCKQLGLLNMQTLWILSRQKDLSPESRERVYSFLRRVGLNVSKLRKTNTNSCIDMEG